jgi:hypothetical protein
MRHGSSSDAVSSSPWYSAHFEVACCRRENKLDAKETLMRVLHADDFREAEVHDDHPSEFGPRKGAGFNHRDREERELCLLAESCF